MGEDGCDVTIQCGNSMRNAIKNPTHKELVDKCNCPILMIAVSGTWFCVLGGVLSDRFIVQRLTGMLCLGLSNTHEENRIRHVAKVLYALKNTVSTITKFYKELPVDSIPEFNELEPHPRNFPYPNCYQDNSGGLVTFQYQRNLEDNPQCVTFLSKEDVSGDLVVIKFVSRYGDEVHKFLAGESRKHAPRLRYYGGLPSATVYPPPKPISFESPPYGFVNDTSISVSPAMMMVVMDYIEPLEGEPDNAHAQVEAIINLLHAEGYVFGDLRGPNVIFDSKGEAMLIDFDWAGCYDKEKLRDSSRQDITRYPIVLSSAITWPDKVENLSVCPIIPEDDLFMLDTHFPA